jgi:hypothetical protein
MDIMRLVINLSGVAIMTGLVVLSMATVMHWLE